jgi:orotate phosphoribosyltransferase
MPLTSAIRIVSPSFPQKKFHEILEIQKPFVEGKHLLYPGDTRGPHAHLPAFFYFSRWIFHPDAILLLVKDLAHWLKKRGLGVDAVFAPADPSVVKVVEALSEVLEKPAVFLEYLPTGRFGEKVFPENILLPGKNVLVFNGVTITGRCVGERLPSFVEKAGAQIIGIAAFAKGTAPGVKKAEEKFGENFYSAIQVDIPMYPPDTCPLCQKGMPLFPWNSEDVLNSLAM